MYSNSLTRLVNKLEGRIPGLIILEPHLPPELGKDKWVERVKEDTLVTFSRYFNYKFPYEVDYNTKRKNGWYYIDEDLIGGAQILGVADLDWSDFSDKNLSLSQLSGLGPYPMLPSYAFSPTDIINFQLRADAASLYNTGIYIDFKYPNMFALRGVGNLNINLTRFVVNVLLVHPDTLHTISPTMMEVFERLALADIATFLYNGLVYFDGVETVFANIDLKLDLIKEIADTRGDVIAELKESYVSAANDAIPYIITV